MEFREFWDNFNRMHNYCSRCDGCPILQKVCNTKNGSACALWCANHPIEAEQIVERWAKEHPILTNGDKFKEIFGRETIILSDDLIRSHNYYESLDE